MLISVMFYTVACSLSVECHKKASEFQSMVFFTVHAWRRAVGVPARHPPRPPAGGRRVQWAGQPLGQDPG
jgi:hypothetical protein